MDQQIFDLLSRRLDKIDDKFEAITKNLAEISADVAKIEDSLESQNNSHDKISDKLATIDTRLNDYNSSLNEHMRRTELLEEGLKSLEDEKVDPLHRAFTEDQIERQILNKRKEQFYKNVKLIGALAAAAAAVLSLYKFFNP